MSFSDDVKLKAQSALITYLGDDCPPHVRNPVLLLNYLHQHAIISSPKYFVIGIRNHLQHAVACKIGDLQMIGNGNTNKIAKSNAAQQFLDLLLKPVNISCVRSSSNSVTSVAHDLSDVHASVLFNNERNISKICVSSLNTEYQFNNYCASNGVNKSTPITCLVKPQSSPDEVAQIHFQSNVFLENIAMDTSKTRNKVSVSKFQLASTRKLKKRKSNRDSDKFSKGTVQVNFYPVAHQQLDFDDFFNPFFMPNMSKSRSKVPLNTYQIAPSPPTQHSDKTCEDELGMSTSCTMASEQPNCDAFFDPFFKQRPTNTNWSTALVMETKNTEDHIIQNQTNESNHTDDIPNVMESKNVFALLQKKTQKHLKLIPRFQIESVESGFRCNVRIGSYHASGDGKNKKEAKTKAAVNLLNQIKDFD